jgi:hypothetical protein
LPEIWKIAPAASDPCGTGSGDTARMMPQILSNLEEKGAPQHEGLAFLLQQLGYL